MIERNFIQSTLEDLLKVEFRIGIPEDEIYDDLVKEEKELFCKVINNMEKLQANEVKIYEEYGLSIATIAETYWDVIEDLIDFMYIEEAADAVWWYIHDRKDSSGKIYEYYDDAGIPYKFNGPEDLFEYIRYKFENSK